MKKNTQLTIKVLAGIALAAIFTLNVATFAESEKYSDLSLSKLKSAMAADENSGGCCRAFMGTCNERTQSSPVTCPATSWIRRTYTSLGVTVGSSISINGGGFTTDWGIQSGTYTDTVGSTPAFPSTIVTCPTDGQCNNCDTYNPCTAILG